MRSSRKYTVTELVNDCYLYEYGHSYRELCEKYLLLLNDSTFYQYYLRFVEHGIAGLESFKVNNTYTQTFKEGVVQEYLQTDSSMTKLAIKYNIPSPSTVHHWILKYTRVNN